MPTGTGKVPLFDQEWFVTTETIRFMAVSPFILPGRGQLSSFGLVRLEEPGRCLVSQVMAFRTKDGPWVVTSPACLSLVRSFCDRRLNEQETNVQF